MKKHEADSIENTITILQRFKIMKDKIEELS